MPALPDRDAFLARGDELWARLWALLGERRDDELCRPGASGPGWTGKDQLGHLAHWHEHALDGIRAIVEGREPLSRSDFDEWNARWFAEDTALTAAGARRRCLESRDQLRSYLEGLTDEQWASATYAWPDGVTEHIHDWAGANMDGHYQEHLDELSQVSWPE